jgi:hypothetical protein
VRTFDSLIYEFCKHYEYPHLKLPNIIRENDSLSIINADKKNLNHIQPIIRLNIYLWMNVRILKNPHSMYLKLFFRMPVLFLLEIFSNPFKRTTREFIMVCVTTDSRSGSLFLYERHTQSASKNIIEIKTALKKSYPEYTQQIDEWHSSSPVEEAKITWIPFSNYGVLYKKMFEFLDTYPHEKSMILTFSRLYYCQGALGDLARVRRIIQQKNINVNTNYKSMDKNMLFLSTANSSKGLEREYVFIMSTFPLEKAFINFSNDLTTNLVTVAISRTKKEVFVCVPTRFF